MIPKEGLGSDSTGYQSIPMYPDCTQLGWSTSMDIDAPVIIFNADLTYGPFNAFWKGYNAGIATFGGEDSLIPEEQSSNNAMIPDNVGIHPQAATSSPFVTSGDASNVYAGPFILWVTIYYVITDGDAKYGGI